MTNEQNPVLRAQPVEEAVAASGFELQCTDEDAANGRLRDNTYPWRSAFFVGSAQEFGTVVDAITEAGFTFNKQPRRDLGALPEAAPVPPDQTIQDPSVARDHATDAYGASWHVAYYKDAFSSLAVTRATGVRNFTSKRIRLVLRRR